MHNPRRNKKQDRILIPIVQVCQTTFTMACTSISTRDNVYMAETSVNAPKEHLVMAKSGPLTAVRNLMGEFDGVKITQKNVNQRKTTLQNKEDEQQDEKQ